MKQSLKVLFFVRKTRALKNGEYPLVMRITHNGTRAEAMIKRSVDKKNWNAKLQRTTKRNLEGQELNRFLETLAI